MEDKLEQIREYIINIEMDENDKTHLFYMLDDLERDIEIENEAYNYLSDEENYD